MTAPQKGESPAGAGRFAEQGTADGSDFHSSGLAEQAALTLEGEAYARAYLRRLQADAVQPGELAVLMAFLTGELLHGACRVVEKALRGPHHA